jgi:hypothetical protein
MNGDQMESIYAWGMKFSHWWRSIMVSWVQYEMEFNSHLYADDGIPLSEQDTHN